MNERIRILHCLRAPVGGLFRHVLDLSEEQAALGHDVGIVMDASSSDPVSERRLAAILPRLSIGVFRIPMGRLPGLGDATAAGAVRDLARLRDIDVLHGHGAKGGAYARIAGRLLARERRRVVTVYTPHGGSLHYPPASPQGALYTAMEKILARFTDGLIFESAYAARLYAQRVGKDVAPSRVITNALQPADFVARATDPDAADFLFVGELRRLKGVDVLLSALAHVREHRPVSAVIVGAGPDATAFAREAARLGLGATVSFRRALPARQAFRLGRALVIPSRAESFPYIALEAAAAGSLPLSPILNLARYSFGCLALNVMPSMKPPCVSWNPSVSTGKSAAFALPSPISSLAACRYTSGRYTFFATSRYQASGLPSGICPQRRICVRYQTASP